MSLLLIDAGNTAIHWAVQEEGGALGPMQRWIYTGEDIDSGISQLWLDQKPAQGVIICSVASDAINSAMRQWFTAHWDVSPKFIVSPVRGHGIQNAYSVAATLGADRWAAMVGAYYPDKTPCAVLDCGTAVTFDVVAAGGKHLGGWIMPGHRLFLHSLSQETASIELIDTRSTTTALVGRSTAECVDIAWHQGIISLVQRTLQTLDLGKVRCYLTGGDGKRLHSLLGDDWCYAEDLVLRGLALMASAD